MGWTGQAAGLGEMGNACKSLIRENLKEREGKLKIRIILKCM
jgi:hypothetical protein